MPLTLSVPVHPPDALHDVAFLEVHVSVVDSPTSSVVVAAFSDTVGGGLAGSEPPPHADNSEIPPIKIQNLNRMAYPVRSCHRRIAAGGAPLSEELSINSDNAFPSMSSILHVFANSRASCVNCPPVTTNPP
jgi:hypothetical protein